MPVFEIFFHRPFFAQAISWKEQLEDIYIIFYMYICYSKSVNFSKLVHLLVIC